MRIDADGGKLYLKFLMLDLKSNQSMMETKMINSVENPVNDSTVAMIDLKNPDRNKIKCGETRLNQTPKCDCETF